MVNLRLTNTQIDTQIFLAISHHHIYMVYISPSGAPDPRPPPSLARPPPRCRPVKCRCPRTSHRPPRPRGLGKPGDNGWTMGPWCPVTKCGLFGLKMCPRCEKHKFGDHNCLSLRETKFLGRKTLKNTVL